MSWLGPMGDFRSIAQTVALASRWHPAHVTHRGLRGSEDETRAEADAVKLWESGAILAYLADRHGPLDTPARRADAGCLGERHEPEYLPASWFVVTPQKPRPPLR